MAVLYYPKDLSPEFVTKDATLAITFSWTPQGLPQTAYQIQVYDYATSTLVYDSTKITSSTPYQVVAGSTLLNDKNYVWNVQIWNNANTIASEYVVFNTSLTPVVAIDSTPYDTQSYTFTSTYTLGTNVGLSKFKYILYDNSDVIIQDSGYIYSAVTEYEFTGFITATTYKIECIVVDDNGLTGTTGKISFTVNYTSPNSVPLVSAIADDVNGLINISWAKIKQLLAVVTGSSSYVTGKFNQGLSLTGGSNVLITETIMDTYTATFYVKIPSTFTGDIAYLTGVSYDLRIFFDGNRFGFEYGGQTVNGNLIPTINLLGTTVSNSLIISNSLILTDATIFSDFIKIGILYGKLIIQAVGYTEIISI